MTSTAREVESQPGTPASSVVRRFGRALRRFVLQMAQRPLGMIGMVMVLVFIVLAIFGPMLAPYPYDKIIQNAIGHAPSPEYPFGVDKLGRDVFSRVIWGTGKIVELPGVATLISVFLGTTIGMALGYYGGLVDEIISRILDSLLAIPALVLALVMLATIGSSDVGIIIVIVLLYVPIVTRVIRSATLNVRSSGFIEAAKLRGESTSYILFREILPSVLPALTVEAALRFSYAIFLTASLGFLGLGVQPPSPDWGRMVNEARNWYVQTPWALWFPAGAIAALIISVNLLSDGLRRIFRYEGQT
jgi:peptide/nickel transport system permease protein